jgi:hypothetical protein
MGLLFFIPPYFGILEIIFPFEVDLALRLNKLEFPLLKDDFKQV